MTDLIKLKTFENEKDDVNTETNQNTSVNNVLDMFDPNTKIVLLGCNLDDNKMIFVLRSVKYDKYIVLILCRFRNTYNILNKDFKIENSDDNFFLSDLFFKDTFNELIKQNDGIVYEYIERKKLDNFISDYLDKCELNFFDERISNFSFVDFVKYLSLNRFITNDRKCVIIGIISNFCDYNCEIYGYNKCGNMTKIYGINDSREFKVKLIREFIIFDKEKILENNEGSFYYHICNFNTNMQSLNNIVFGYFLKIDVCYEENLNDVLIEEEFYTNILEFDKTEILKPDEELAWSVIKGMILIEL